MSKSPASQTARLPRLVVGRSSWLLPLNDYASFELARILIVDEPAERRRLVAELMSVDPCLALWTACAVAHGGTSAPCPSPAAGHSLADQAVAAGSVPCCVMDLAQWFVQQSPHVLRWSDKDLAEAAQPRELRPRWRELAADAVAVASLAADQVADDQVAAEAFLFGLLHNAADWLGSCGPRVSVSKHQLGCLPAWLVTWLRERSRPPRSEPVRHVARAAKLWRESGRRARQVAGIDLTEALLARALAHRRPIGRSQPTFPGSTDGKTLATAAARARFRPDVGAREA